MHGYKGLSEPGREMVKKQIARIIAFVSQCEQAVETAGNDGIPEIELDELDERIGEEEERVKCRPRSNDLIFLTLEKSGIILHMDN
jgi:hypothetical protein